MADRRHTRGRRLEDLATHDAGFITIEAFAGYLDVDAKTVRKWLAAGVLPGHDFEGIKRIKVDEARAFVERSRMVPR